MQNRLDGATEAQAASEKQLAELHAAVAAERAARPESVNHALPVCLWGSFTYALCPPPPLFPFLAGLGATWRGAGSTGCRKESVCRAARRTRGVWRV